MRRPRLHPFGFSLIFGLFSVFLLPSIAHTNDKNPALELNFTEVASGIFVHFGRQEAMSIKNHGDIANIGFIAGEKTVAVIDPGGSPLIGNLMKVEIQTRLSLPVSHVILTHVHPDHVFGGSAFADVPIVIAHRNFNRAVTQRAAFYRDAYSELFLSADQVTTLLPTEVNFDRMEIDLGGRILTIEQHSTAHTDNDITVWDQQTRTLWASDLLFAQRTPSLDGSLTGWLTTMNFLELLNPGLVIPGHGLAGSWHNVAEPQTRYLHKLLTQTRAAITLNQRLADTVDTVAKDEAGQWLLFDDQHPRNVTKAFTELEWE